MGKVIKSRVYKQLEKEINFYYSIMLSNASSLLAAVSPAHLIWMSVLKCQLLTLLTHSKLVA